MRSPLEIFSCCTVMHPPTKLQVFVNFWPPKKCYNHLSPPNTLQIYLLQTIFSPKLKKKWK
jgi:hypothetical protein